MYSQREMRYFAHYFFKLNSVSVISYVFYISMQSGTVKNVGHTLKFTSGKVPEVQINCL